MGVTYSGNAATPAGGESGGRHTVRLWGGRAGPVFRGKSVANLNRKAGHRQQERISASSVYADSTYAAPSQGVASSAVLFRLAPTASSPTAYLDICHDSHSGNTHSKDPERHGPSNMEHQSSHSVTVAPHAGDPQHHRKIASDPIPPPPGLLRLRACHLGEFGVDRCHGPSVRARQPGTHARPAAGGVSRRA
jgi:hypothetical protein